MAAQVEEIRKPAFLQDGDLAVVPVTDDKLLARAYLRFESEGLTETIFGEAVPTLSAWIVARINLPTLLALRGSQPVGLGWLNSLTRDNPANAKCDATIAFFAGTSGAEKLRLGRLMVSWVFENLDMNVMLTLSAETHRASVFFVRRLGFEMYGPIPNLTATHGVPCGGWLGAMTRDRWREKYGR